MFARTLVFAAVATAFSGLAMAAPGDLDLSFNASGYRAIVGDSSPSAWSICIDAKQRIVVAGTRQASAATWQSYLLRLAPSGADNTIDWPEIWRPVGFAAAMPQQPALACAGDQYGVTTLDGPGPSFSIRLDRMPADPSNWGKVSQLLFKGLATKQPRVALTTPLSGRWLVGPSIASNATTETAVLQRWEGDNSSLVYQGVLSGPSGSPRSAFTEAMTLASGGTLAVGRRSNTTYDSFIAAFDANGNPQSGFGSGGLVHWSTPEHDYGQRIAAAANGRFFVGVSEISASTGVLIGARIIRYQSNGGIDASFAGPMGLTIAQLDLGDVAEDAQGRVVVVGTRDGTAFVQRFSASGTADASFGPGGIRSFGFGSLGASLYGVAIDSSGRIVVVGKRDQAVRGGQVVPAALIVARIQS